MASSLSSSSDGVPHGRTREAGTGEPKPQLETLISHLVAAKRSLSAISHVWRANEIVNTARTALEESVVVSARTSFLRRGQRNQIRLLYNVRAEVENISRCGRADFANVLKELDDEHERLRFTLDKLRETAVHPAFRPEGEGPKTLHDFVDERGVEDLQKMLKGAIDRTNEVQRQLDTSTTHFDDELQSMQQALGRYRSTMELISSQSSNSHAASPGASGADFSSPLSIPSMLRSLESHAQEMADLLESLVRHFDLCVTAVKHTEGGGAAARSITGDIPTGVNVGVRVGNDIDDGDINHLEPMTESDYQEMLDVLTKDAAEAEDVVLEVQDRIADMESVLDNVLSQRDSLTSIYHATTDIFEHLSTLASTHLPDCIAQAHTFTQIWNDEKDRIRSGIADLSDLRSLYVGFLDAYDGLILEVARRKHVRQGVEKILREARTKLDQLYEEDVNSREAFRVEQGDYLPSDIWPGLGRGPMQVRFFREPTETFRSAGDGSEKDVRGECSKYPNDDTGDGGDSIPDLPKHVVDDAIARLKARAKGVLI